MAISANFLEIAVVWSGMGVGEQVGTAEGGTSMRDRMQDVHMLTGKAQRISQDHVF